MSGGRLFVQELGQLAFFVCVIAFFQPDIVCAQEPDLKLVLKLVENLQVQLTTYQGRVEKQEQMIHLQGQEIASLKNVIETVQGRIGAPIASKDEAHFKEHVQDVLQGIRLSEAQQTPAEKQLTTIYDDGFYLKGKDDTVRIGGWYQGDVNVYDRGNEGNTRFRNRAVRLDIRGVLENDFEYRLYSQFAGASAHLQEAWLMYKHFPNARIKLGQVLVPFSLESQYSARWLDFMERSLGVSNLQPAEDLGFMIFGSPLAGAVEYAVGVFNGRARTFEDNNDNFDFGGRLVLAPFLKSGHDLLREFYVGGSAITGHSDETLAGGGFTTAGGSRFLTYASSTRHANNRTRFGGELQWIYGPGDVKAEYVGARFDDVERSGVKGDVHVDSWYASASYLLTREKKVRNKPIVPKKIFSIKDGTWGAWEVAIRFEQFFVNDSPFSLGLASGTDGADAYTAALNWWPNKHIRFMFDYVFNKFFDPVTIGSESEDGEHLFLGRAQYDF